MCDQKRELQQLKEQLHIVESIDNVIEVCQQEKMSLRKALKVILTQALSILDARGGFIYSYDETLKQRFFFTGIPNMIQAYDLESARLITESAVQVTGDEVILIEPLDVVGEQIGVVGFLFKQSDRDIVHMQKLVVCFNEQLDNYLYNIVHERHKQQMIDELNRAIHHPVLGNSIHNAVVALKKKVDFKELLLFYYDATETNISYRFFVDEPRRAEGIWEVEKNRDFEKIIENQKRTYILGDINVPEKLNFSLYHEVSLISGSIENCHIGKIIVTNRDDHFNTYEQDLINVFGQIVNYRLVDFNREQRTLRRFFSKESTFELLKHPDYMEKYLTPRVKDVAVFYADINSFTKISEQILIDPALIARFVEKWSRKAIEIVFENDGVFDKIVGDCIIALFGPPFFQIPKEELVIRSLKAVYELQQYTIALGNDAEFSAIKDAGMVDGLGVAVGINFTPMAVGIVNEDYTGFSSGMNNTARLQSLAGFREIFVMDHLKEIIEQSSDPFSEKIVFKSLQKTLVKNVAEPLEYYGIEFIGDSSL